MGTLEVRRARVIHFTNVLVTPHQAKPLRIFSCDFTFETEHLHACLLYREARCRFGLVR